MNKLSAMWSLFHKGEELANADKWKQHQITTTVLAGFILALVQVAGAFGYALPIDSSTATAIGAGIIGFVNVILTIITSKRVGLPVASEPPRNDLQQAQATTLPATTEKQPVQPLNSSNDGLEQARGQFEDQYNKQWGKEPNG